MLNCAIYLRTSTSDQDPEKQKNACMEFARSRGYNIKEILIEKLSGYKQIVRPEYERIKQMAHQGEINAVVVWALDRWVRNRDTLLEDVSMLKNYNVKLHSVKEQWLEAINIEGSLGKTIQDFILGLIGSLGEMESERRSERVKMAFQSYKNNERKYKKWGRKELPERVVKEVLDHYDNGHSIREISESVFYYDRHSNRKKISIGGVHKIIKKNRYNIDK
jgi:DNA invertase Pin-like site-specific DNA recombinase